METPEAERLMCSGFDISVLKNEEFKALNQWKMAEYFTTPNTANKLLMLQILEFEPLSRVRVVGN